MADNASSPIAPGFRRHFGRLLLLVVPVINVAAALFWALWGADQDTKAFGRAALVVLLLLVALSVVAGLVSYSYLNSALLSASF